MAQELTNRQVRDQLTALMDRGDVDPDAMCEIFVGDPDRPDGPERAYYTVANVSPLVGPEPSFAILDAGECVAT